MITLTGGGGGGWRKGGGGGWRKGGGGGWRKGGGHLTNWEERGKPATRVKQLIKKWSKSINK